MNVNCANQLAKYFLFDKFDKFDKFYSDSLAHRGFKNKDNTNKYSTLAGAKQKALYEQNKIMVQTNR
jgi:hypothetical protein